jgi:hypothetical protein
VKWSQICSFRTKSIRFNVFFTVKSIVVFQASAVLLSYWAVETLGDLQFTSRGLDQGVKCKTIIQLPILMHQMRFSITYLFSDAQVEKVGNLKWYDCKPPPPKKKRKKKKTPKKHSAVKSQWSQIRRRLELWIREIILRFLNEFINSNVFFTIKFIFVFLNKYRST